MPLLVHSSSQCDVCLDPYSWTTPDSDKAPHAIQCGHIFCLRCLITVGPRIVCPLCRKPYNKERIKRLVVDKVDGDGSGPAGPVKVEIELFRRIAALFNDTPDNEDIRAVIEEVNSWVQAHPRLSGDASESHPLSSAVTGLLSYINLQREKTQVKEEIQRLRLAHERHVTVKNKDSEMSALIEQNLVRAKTQAEEEAERLRREVERLTAQLKRYTHPSNPLPRPPEVNPVIRQTLAILPPPLGAAPSAAAPTGLADRTSPRDATRTHGSTSLRFADSAATEGERPGDSVTSPPETLRRENRRRPHLIIPGATAAQKVLPEDIDMTPRAVAGGTPRLLGMYAGDDWPYDYPDPRPVPGGPIWFPTDPNLIPPGIPNVVTYHPPSARDAGTTVAPVTGNPAPEAAGPSMTGGQPTGPPPIPTASIPHMSSSARMPIDSAAKPIVGRSTMDWRSGNGPEGGRCVLVHHPELGNRWIPKEKVHHLPRRLMGTESNYPYVVVTEPDAIDREPGQPRRSPGPNPLQLTGLPINASAGPSSRVIPPQEENALLSAAGEGSALLNGHPETTARPAVGTAIGDVSHFSNSSHPGPSGLYGTMRRSTSDMPATQLGLDPGPSTSAHPAVNGHLAAESLPDLSPAPSWGTVNTSEPSSLSLGIANFSNNPQPADSMEQLGLANFSDEPIGFGFVGARDSPLSSISHSRRPSVASSSVHSRGGSTRQVVTGLQDLEAINRSLSDIAQPSQPDRRSSRSSASSRHSRHSSLSGPEPGSIIGPRTGLALYSSRPATQHSSSGPSPVIPSPLAQARSESQASTRERVESSRTHGRSASSLSLHRSISERPPRTATTAAAPPVNLSPASWSVNPSDTQPSGSRGPYAESHPRTSQDSIPRSLAAVEGIGGISGSLMLSFEAPSTSAAVDREGREAAGIHAPRPVNSRRSSNFFRVTFNRSSDR